MSAELTAEERAYVEGLHDPLVDEAAFEVIVEALLNSIERKAGLEVVR